jgi:hypothetical protein
MLVLGTNQMRWRRPVLKVENSSMLVGCRGYLQQFSSRFKLLTQVKEASVDEEANGL